jgi:tRNA threonylcarbamoyladenosine biosynthesis protein TsaB
MLVLALDTSSAAGSAALVREGRVLVERAGDPSRTHGERLPRELMAVLDEAGLSLHDIDRFAVSIGPGSFTGLRVGIATIQGLALARNRLVVPVSSFAALSFPTSGTQPPTSGTRPPTSGVATAVWIDAHRGEVFGTLFGADGTTELAPPTALKPGATFDAWAPALMPLERIRFAGDGAIRYRDAIVERLGDRAVVDAAVPPIAGTIGLIASADGARGVRPHAIVPLYVRRSDAELARDRRQAPDAP